MSAERGTEGVLPKETPIDGEPKLGVKEAVQKLGDIWFRYALAGQTPEALDVRRSDLDLLNKQLSEEASEYLLDTLLSDDGKDLTRGQRIQVDALKAGSVQLRKERQMQIDESPKKSRGERVSIRRQKAHERRGTRPGLIH